MSIKKIIFFDDDFGNVLDDISDEPFPDDPDYEYDESIECMTLFCPKHKNDEASNSTAKVIKL